jgi:Rieske Fe-S protein
MQDNTNSRRSFLKKSAGAAGAVVLSTPMLALMGCEETTFKNPVNPPPSETGLTIEGALAKIDTATTSYAILRTIGGFKKVSALGKNFLVFRTGTTSVSAVSSICTHQGCDLTPGGPNSSELIDTDKVQCGCHGSTFNVETGARLGGPAQTPLQKFPATVSGNTITVDLT